MAVTGSQRKQTEFKRKIGIFTGEVVAINPSAEQIAKLYEQEEVKDEPVYTKEKEVDVPTGVLGEDGKPETEKVTVNTVRIDVYFETVGKDSITTKKSFFLEDRPFLKKDASSRQYINVLGKTAWADHKENLPTRFTNKVEKDGTVGDGILFREAKVGEADFIEFLDAWLRIDKFKPYELSIDVSKLFRENFKELTDLLKGGADGLTGLVMGALTVREVTNDEGIKFYQDVWKKFIPDFNAKFFANTKYDETKLDLLREKQKALKAIYKSGEKAQKTDYLKPYEKFALDLSDSEYGCKDHYSLRPIHDFNPDEVEVNHAAPLDTASADY